MMKIHVRAPAGTRLEQTERVVDNVQRAVRQIIPRDEIDSISDNIGVPPFAFLLAFYQNDSVGPQDSAVSIALNPQHHATAGYPQQIGESLSRQYPHVYVYFHAADIHSSCLTF